MIRGCECILERSQMVEGSTLSQYLLDTGHWLKEPHCPWEKIDFLALVTSSLPMSVHQKKSAHLV